MFNWLFKWFKPKSYEKQRESMPKFTITCILEPDDSGYHVEVDWDINFIKSLRHRGYNGITEEDIAALWVRDLYLAQSAKLNKEGNGFL